jgi:hypothetical protein
MRLSTRMMIMRTGRIPVRKTVSGAILAKPMAMMMERVRKTHRALRMGPGKTREHRMGRGKGRRKGKGWGMEMVKGKELLNKTQGEMISHVPLLCSCRS